MCVRNTGHPASLELRKIYEVLPDVDGSAHGLIRVIDESGEDYLYPEKFFIPIELPHAIGRSSSSCGLRPCESAALTSASSRPA